MIRDPFDPAFNGGLAPFHPPLAAGEAALPLSLALAQHPPQRIGSSPGGCFACRPSGYRREEAPAGPYFPAPENETSALAIEVHSLQFGDADWLPECLPTIREWCRRHAHPLKIWRQNEIPVAYPNPKFIAIDALRGFLEGSNERFLWIDADVICHPLAPEFPAHEPGVHALIDRPSGAVKSWPAWLVDHYQANPGEGFRYRNAGIWACDRASAAALLREAERMPLIEGWMEQHQWNAWLLNSGVVIHDLPPRWNSFPKTGPAWFHHFAGKDKLSKILKERARGWLPDAVNVMENPPAVPDFGEGAVVWPWSSTAAEWDELWFSHRSVLEHWKEKHWPLVLLADRRPDWWPGEFIHASRYEDALWIGTQCAERVLWMNDDIFMLADQGPADFQQADQLGAMTAKLGASLVAPNAWRRGLGQVLMRCHHHGKPVLNFSTHTPYFYQRAKAREILARFGVFRKIPFETAYHNWHRTPNRPCSAKSKRPDALEGMLWINPAFRQVNADFREEMGRRFGNPPGA